MKYLLNSAVITAPGRYDYRHISAAEAREWYAAGPVTSTIGYAETAAALAELLGAAIPVDRRTIVMQPGDEALVFRLVLPPGSTRIDPRDKGALGREVLAGHYELGILRRERRSDVQTGRRADRRDGGAGPHSG